MGNFSLTDVKVFYDQHGQPSEVLMDYKLFRQIEAKLLEVMSDDELSHLWDEVWQDQVANRPEESSTMNKNIDEGNTLEWLDK